MNKVGRKSENEQEQASQDHSLAAPEVSKSHPHERAYHEANEVGGSLQAKLGIREAKELRDLRYEIRSSFLSVKEIGGSEIRVTGHCLVTLSDYSLLRSAVNGDILSILKKRNPVDDPRDESKEESEDDSST